MVRKLCSRFFSDAASGQIELPGSETQQQSEADN